MGEALKGVCFLPGARGGGFRWENRPGICVGNSARVGSACFLFPCAAQTAQSQAVPHGQEAQCHWPSLCSEIEEQDAGVQGFLTPPGTDVLLVIMQECGVGGTAMLPSVWQSRTSCPHQLHCGGEVPALLGPSQVTHGGGRQQSFSRHAAKSGSTGTLRQLNPDFLSQLPVPRP